MWYLFLLLLAIPLLAWMIGSFPQQEQSKRNLLFVIIVVVLYSLAGLRNYRTWNDTDAYNAHYNRVNDTGAFYEVPTQRFEKGYLVLEKFVHKYVSQNFYVFLQIVMTITLLPTFLFFYRKSKWLWLAIFLYLGTRCYFTQTAAIRQGMAMSMLLLSTLCMEKKKFVCAITLCVLATLFHRTAIVGTLMLPLSMLEVKRKNVLMVFSVALLSFVCMGFILEFLGAGNSKYMGDENLKLGNIISLAFNSALLFYVYKTNKSVLHEDRLMSWGAILCIAFCFSSLMVTAFNRATMYFEPYLIAVLCNAMAELEIERRIKATFVCAIAFLMFVGVQLFKPQWNCLYPYHFLWEENCVKQIPKPTFNL